MTTNMATVIELRYKEVQQGESPVRNRILMIENGFLWALQGKELVTNSTKCFFN
jgi:hypothetical protein